MKEFEIGVTKNVVTIIKTFCKGDEEKTKQYIRELGNKISDIPKSNHMIETSDNFIKFNGIPLSFIRDWKEMKIVILTNAEGEGLDNKTKVFAFTIN